MGYFPEQLAQGLQQAMPLKKGEAGKIIVDLKKFKSPNN